MEPDTTGSGYSPTWLRRIHERNARLQERARHTNDHNPRGGPARRKKARKATQASKRRNRR